MPLHRFLLSAGLLGIVVVLGVAVLTIGGWAEAGPALAAGSLIVLVQVFLLRNFLGGLGGVRRGVAEILDDPDHAIPMVKTESPLANDLWLSILRLTRLFRLRVQRAESDLMAVNGLLRSLPDPLFLIGDRRQIMRVNEAVRELFGRNLQDRDLAAAIRNPAVLSATDAVLAGGEARVIEFDLAVPVDRHLRARIERLAEQPADGAAALLTLTDLTALKRAEQMRGDFVANASHELRTPLATLIGFIETLEGPASDDAEARRRFLPIMRQQAARMARLVEDLMSLSRIEMNEHLPPREQVDLPGVLKTVIQALQLVAGGRGMRLELALAEALPAVLGDPDELVQVFQNLIDNAIKYARDNTAITVTAQPSEKLRNGLAVAIRDHGEGIAREHLPRLTERFYRVDTARSRVLGGTGLGLAIVKHIISRHRGLLEIDSQLGEGSTFTVHLPPAAAPAELIPQLSFPHGPAPSCDKHHETGTELS